MFMILLPLRTLSSNAVINNHNCFVYNTEVSSSGRSLFTTTTIIAFFFFVS